MPEQINGIPFPNGTKVAALTYSSIEYDREAEEIEGILTTHPSPFGVPQCWVDGLQVQPETVHPLDDYDDDIEDEDVIDTSI